MTALIPDNYCNTLKEHPRIVAYLYLGWQRVYPYEGDDDLPVSMTIALTLS